MPKSNGLKIAALKKEVERSEIAHREKLLRLYNRINKLEFEDECERARKARGRRR